MPNGRNAGRLFADPEGRHGFGRSYALTDEQAKQLADFEANCQESRDMLLAALGTPEKARSLRRLRQAKGYLDAASSIIARETKDRK